ncbi:hypothetical protein AHF37_04750 [Paragonimus kellicotti]|nr:hypothetical protein AHF37_04750 [Paragonimus kellicotti]
MRWFQRRYFRRQKRMLNKLLRMLMTWMMKLSEKSSLSLYCF